MNDELGLSKAKAESESEWVWKSSGFRICKNIVGIWQHSDLNSHHIPRTELAPSCDAHFRWQLVAMPSVASDWLESW